MTRKTVFKKHISAILIPFVTLSIFISGCTKEEGKEEILPKKITVQEKKARFHSLLVPAVNEVYESLEGQYRKVSESIKTGTNSAWVEKLKNEYRATTDEELLMALKPHPRSIALAQAAMESSWATSRFFAEANNVFGVWSFNENEPRIAAAKKRGNKTIWVKKYSSIKASIQDYYRTLGRGRAFAGFRKLKMQTDNPFELVKKLDKYSEKGADYGKELTAIIRFNQYRNYDRQKAKIK